MPTPEREPFQFLGVNIIFDETLDASTMIMSGHTPGGAVSRTYVNDDFDTDYFLHCRRAFHAAYRTDPDDARVGTVPFDRASQIAALNATLVTLANAEAAPRRLTASEITARAAAASAPGRAPAADPRLWCDTGTIFPVGESDDGDYTEEYLPPEDDPWLRDMPTISIRAGVRLASDEEGDDRHFAAVTLEFKPGSITFCQRLPLDYSEEFRVNAMKAMRLALFKKAQDMVRRNFEFEKRHCPEVWERNRSTARPTVAPPRAPDPMEQMVRQATQWVARQADTHIMDALRSALPGPSPATSPAGSQDTTPSPALGPNQPPPQDPFYPLSMGAGWVGQANAGGTNEGIAVSARDYTLNDGDEIPF